MKPIFCSVCHDYHNDHREGSEESHSLDNQYDRCE